MKHVAVRRAEGLGHRSGGPVAALLARWVLAVGLGLGGSACHEIGDALSAGERERESNEANRARLRAERNRNRLHGGLDLRGGLDQPKAALPDVDKGRELLPDTPGFRLKAELIRRLACNSERCRGDSLERIKAAADRLLPGIPVLLEGQPEGLVLEAIRLAGLFKHRPAADAIGRTALVTARKPVRKEAIWAIGEIGGQAATKYLTRLAGMDTATNCHKDLCRALSKNPGPVVAAAVAELTKATDPAVKEECLGAMMVVGGPLAVEQCRRELQGDAPEVVRAARRCLERLDDPKAAAALKAFDRASNKQRR